MTGGLGQPPRFMKKPMTPKTAQLSQSPIDAPPSHAPMNTKRSTPGTTSCPGSNATFATWLTVLSSTNVATTLAIAIIHTKLKVMGSSVLSMLGPGRSPCMISAPIRIEVPTLPGMPRVNVGISAPPRSALLAASGASRPRTSPCPNCELSLTLCLACAYVTQPTIEAPNPGSMPI